MLFIDTGQAAGSLTRTVRDISGLGLALLQQGSTAQTLAVSNSSFIGNSSGGMIVGTLSSGAVTASIDRTALSGSAVGLTVDGQSGTGALTVAVTDSVVTNNHTAGFKVDSTTGKSISNLTLTHSQAVGNNVGVQAIGANATLWLTGSIVAGSATGYAAMTGGVINTFGNNYIVDITSTGTLIPVTAQ